MSITKLLQISIINMQFTEAMTPDMLMHSSSTTDYHAAGNDAVTITKTSEVLNWVAYT